MFKMCAKSYEILKMQMFDDVSFVFYESEAICFVDKMPSFSSGECYAQPML